LGQFIVSSNWNDLNHEDIGIIERMQQGRNSDGFDGGVLSTLLGPGAITFRAPGQGRDCGLQQHRKLIHINV